MRKKGDRRVLLMLAPLACGIFCACAHDALSAEEHQRFGVIFEAHGLSDDAIEQYRRAVTLNPADLEGLMALGNIQFQRGHYARAAGYYRRALKVSPSCAGAQNDLAMTYLARNKDLGEAERLALGALRPDGPLNAYAYDTLAKIYEREGRSRDASAAAEHAAQAQASESPVAPAAELREAALMPQP